MRTLDQLDVAGKRVLVRADFNVPLDKATGAITDDARIRAALPTIEELRGKGARLVLCSHLGRPKGPDPALSLRPVAERLSELLGTPVALADALDGIPDADVVLLENVRFNEGETKNDEGLARRYAALADAYVNDAFGSAHRAHASTEAVAHLLASAAGRLLEREVKTLTRVLRDPERPLVAVVGGAKVSTKIDLLENLVGKVDALVIGGGMANTFIHATGLEIGRSLAEKDLAETALRIVERARETGCAIILPVDAVCAFEFKAGAHNHTYGIDAIPADRMILDVGSQSVERIQAAINDAATLVWNGPLGAFEIAPFDQGTVAAARHAAERTRAGKLVSVAGGGDTVAALNHAGVAESFSYVSTAGGAFLEWLEGKTLPGVEALRA